LRVGGNQHASSRRSMRFRAPVSSAELDGGGASDFPDAFQLAFERSSSENASAVPPKTNQHLAPVTTHFFRAAS